MWRSVRHTAQALTAISTSPAVGFGGGSSVIASGRCAAVSTWARIGTSRISGGNRAPPHQRNVFRCLVSAAGQQSLGKPDKFAILQGPW
jgi:hypothetical protein